MESAELVRLLPKLWFSAAVTSLTANESITEQHNPVRGWMHTSLLAGAAGRGGLWEQAISKLRLLSATIATLNVEEQAAATVLAITGPKD